MALLDKWIALDIGAYLARFYDFSTQNQVALKTIIAKKGSKIVGVSDEALTYLYKDLDEVTNELIWSSFISTVDKVLDKYLRKLDILVVIVSEVDVPI